MALSHHPRTHHPRDGRTSEKQWGRESANWLCRPHFTDWKERAGNLMQMCPPKLSLPTACAIADGVGFVCAVYVCVCIHTNVLMRTWFCICHHYSEYYTLLVAYKDFF